MSHIRVAAETRDALTDIRHEKTLGGTIAYLCGCWMRVNAREADIRGHETFTSDGCAVTTTVRVSEDCHAVLQKIQDELGAESISETVGILIANHRLM